MPGFLNSFWTGICTVISIVALSVLAALGHPVPTLLGALMSAIVGGHLALTTPTLAPLSSAATPRAPPAPVAAAAAPAPATAATAPIQTV